MSVEDTASQSCVVFGIQDRDPISGAHVSPGSAETLVRIGRITNLHSLAYSLSNISAKNYENRLMCIEIIVCYISVVFKDTVYMYYCGILLTIPSLQQPVGAGLF